MSTVAKTLAERGSRYGEFADHARIAQGLQDVMRGHPNWDKLDLDMKQALTVIADKIARILNGDPFYIDNWHDLQGYAKLIEDRLQMIETEAPSLYAEDAHFEEIPDILYDPNSVHLGGAHSMTFAEARRADPMAANS